MCSKNEIPNLATDQTFGHLLLEYMWQPKSLSAHFASSVADSIPKKGPSEVRFVPTWNLRHDLCLLRGVDLGSETSRDLIRLLED